MWELPSSTSVRLPEQGLDIFLVLLLGCCEGIKPGFRVWGLRVYRLRVEGFRGLGFRGSGFRILGLGTEAKFLEYGTPSI